MLEKLWVLFIGQTWGTPEHDKVFLFIGYAISCWGCSSIQVGIFWVAVDYTSMTWWSSLEILKEIECH